MATAGLIYVLLPVHNRRPVTERFVRQLVEQTDQGFQLVLIDDGSRDDTAESIRTLLPQTTVITGTGSWWWAGALQEGFDWLLAQPTGDGDLVLIVNDDVSIDPAFLAVGREIMSGLPRSLVLAHTYAEGSDTLLDAGVFVDWKRLKLWRVRAGEPVNCLSTRGLFFRREDLASLGRFHRRILPHYLSDYEMTIRAGRRGLALVPHGDLRVRVDEAGMGAQLIRARSASEYLRKGFSRRSAMNPLYWSSFVLLASPRRFIPINLARVWRWFLGDMWRSTRSGGPSSSPGNRPDVAGS